MYSNIHSAEITNFTADRGSDGGTHFYSLAKYWTANHERPVQPWDADENQEFFLEIRSYTGPAPCHSSEDKYTLTAPQYAQLLFHVAAFGPDSAHTYIAKQRSAWQAAATT